MTPEHAQQRVGKVTASRVADIIRTTKTGVSASRQRYMGELVAERMTGVPAESFKSADMQWGNDTEAAAIEAYKFYKGGRLVKLDFINHSQIEMAGCSPDHLVDDDGLIEAKCPVTHTHIETLLGAPVNPDYVTQMQWQMACTGRAWCDFISFDPRMPEDLRLVVKRVERDLVITELEKAVRKFLVEADEKVQALNQLREAA